LFHNKLAARKFVKKKILNKLIN